MSLLSPPYSAKLTLERDSGISFKSSFSLQGTREMMEWGAAVYPEPTLVRLYFSSFSFPPVSISHPCTISISSQALNCIDILMTPITTSLAQNTSTGNSSFQHPTSYRLCQVHTCKIEFLAMEPYITSEQAVCEITIHFHSNGKF